MANEHNELLAELKTTKQLLLASNKRIEKQQAVLQQALNQLGVKIETISVEESNRDSLLATRVGITKTLVAQESTRLAWIDKIVEVLKWILHLR